MTTLIYDANYLAYRSKAIAEANIDPRFVDMAKMEDKEYRTKTITSFVVHLILHDIIENNKIFKPEKVILAWDSTSWRKKIYPEYKANRSNKRSTDNFDYNHFYSTLNEVHKFLCLNSKWQSIKTEPLEGDDIIYLYCKYIDPQEDKIVYTADKDLLQLFRFKNVKIFNPLKKEFRTKNDLKFDKLIVESLKKWSFVKTICGDDGDNVGKVFEGKKIGPVKAAKLYAPENNFTELRKLFEEDSEYEKRFERNIVLMDLDYIPSKYIEVFRDEVNKIYSYEYSYQNVMEFLSKYELKNLIDRMEDFIASILMEKL